MAKKKQASKAAKRKQTAKPLKKKSAPKKKQAGEAVQVQARAIVPNPIQILRDNHAALTGLFEKFAQAKDDESKRKAVGNALIEISIHATIEEDVLYPFLRETVKNKKLVEESLQEAQDAAMAVMEISGTGFGEERYRRFKSLAETIKRHIKKEQEELFPVIEKMKNLGRLGNDMSERRKELQRVRLFL